MEHNNLFFYDRQYVDPRQNDNEILQGAIFRNDNVLLTRLLAWEGANGETIDPTLNCLWDHHSDTKYDALHYAISIRSLGPMCILLEWEGRGELDGKRLDPTSDNNYAIRLACDKHFADSISHLLRWKGTGLLEGKQVDATVNDNECIQKLSDGKVSSLSHAYTINALLQDKRVMSSLSDIMKRRLEKFM